MKLRPAFRIGWTRAHPKETLVELLDHHGADGYWNYQERCRWNQLGTAGYLDPYFQFGLGTGDTALLLFDDERVCGCVLIRNVSDGDTPIRTIAAICAVSGFRSTAATYAMQQVLTLFPGRWRVTPFPEEDHLSLQHWGERIIPRILSSALSSEAALIEIVRPSDYRMFFSRPTTPEMLEAYQQATSSNERYRAVQAEWEPFERRGLNLSSYWNRSGSLEIRYANGSLDYQEIRNTVELYLKYLSAIAEGSIDARSGGELAKQLGVDEKAVYPPALPTPSDCAAVFPCAYKLPKQSVFRLYDPTAEYADEYLHCLGNWLEKNPQDCPKEQTELRLDYKIDNDNFNCEVISRTGEKIRQLREELSVHAAKAIKEFIAEHGNEEPLLCKKMVYPWHG